MDGPGLGQPASFRPHKSDPMNNLHLSTESKQGFIQDILFGVWGHYHLGVYIYCALNILWGRANWSLGEGGLPRTPNPPPQMKHWLVECKKILGVATHQYTTFLWLLYWSPLDSTVVSTGLC